jgi:hypothetical protein
VKRLVALAVVLVSFGAAAQPLPSARPTGAPTSAPAARATAAPSAQPSAAPSAQPKTPPMPDEMPPGHPPAGMPPDHPPVESPGVFRPPPDLVRVDESLPAGTIDIVIADAENRPLPNVSVVLGVFEQSVEKGDKRSKESFTTDASGRVTLSERRFGSGISYRVVAEHDGATFTTEPFGLKDKGGIRVTLHAYDAVGRLSEALVVMEALVLLDIREDSIAVQHRLSVSNLRGEAWLATDSGVRLPLPEGARAFGRNVDAGSPEDVWDIRIIERDGALELTGTFPPGQTDMLYHYQVPLEGGSEQRLQLPLPPRVVRTTVVVGAGPKMSLEVKGFPEARVGNWMNGMRVLQTARDALTGSPQEFLADLAPQVLDVKLGGIPTPGPARLIAVALAAVALLGGAFAFHHLRTQRGPRTEEIAELREAHAALLEEVARLERARIEGEIGPQTYGRVREALVDAIARLETRIALLEPKKPEKKARRAEPSDGVAKAPARPRTKKRKAAVSAAKSKA